MEPYLNNINYNNYNNNNNCYINIITINKIPEGPLKYFVRRINRNPLSNNNKTFNNYKKCNLVLLSLNSLNNQYNNNYNNNNKCNNFLTPDDIPDLFSFLTYNGYIIDTNLTKMINCSPVKLNDQTILCFFNYINKN